MIYRNENFLNNMKYFGKVLYLYTLFHRRLTPETPEDSYGYARECPRILRKTFVHCTVDIKVIMLCTIYFGPRQCKLSLRQLQYFCYVRHFILVVHVLIC